jgi:DNA-binding CsgD family transcriptional regulator
MQQAIKVATGIKAEAHPGNTPYVFIENFAHVKGGTAVARRLYLDFTNSLDGLLGSFPYGLPPFFRLSFNFSRRLHLHRYRVRMVPCYADAVRYALELLAEHGTAAPEAVSLSQPHKREPKGGAGDAPATVSAATTADQLAFQVDLLLEHLGDLDLERPGIPEVPLAGRNSAMQPVYETLMLLKMDMDQFLAEHRSLMDAQQERHHKLLRKTAAIEARNRELQALLRKSGEDQTRLGENMRRHVQTLLKPLAAMMARDARSIEQQEWIEGLTERIDDLTRDLLPRLNLCSYQLTPQEIRIARMIRDGVRSKSIARRLGLSVRTVESFRSRLRVKLGIRGQPRNLRTVLLTIPDR